MKILTEYQDRDIPATLKAEPLFDRYTGEMNITIKDFRPGEAVGIYLSYFDSRTKALIESLLAEYTIKRVVEKDGKRKMIERHYTPHNITLKYKDEQYKLGDLMQWKEPYADPKNPKRTKYIIHPMHAMFLSEIEKRKEKYEAKKLKEQYELISDNYDLPEEHEIEEFLRETAPLYEVDVDYEDNLSKYRAYYQIRFYLEHDFPYSKPAPVIAISDEKMFNPEMFNFDADVCEQDIEVESFGDSDYLEDTVYKYDNCID